MATEKMTRIAALKEFFGKGLKPITNKELLDFAKADPDGFNELADGALREVTQTKN